MGAGGCARGCDDGGSTEGAAALANAAGGCCWLSGTFWFGAGKADQDERPEAAEAAGGPIAGPVGRLAGLVADRRASLVCLCHITS